MEIKLTGPTAALGLVAVLGFGAYRMVSMQTELETEALEQLEAYLAAEYGSAEVAALSDAMESQEPLADSDASARAERIVASQNISFPSVNARGMWEGRDGGDVVVRVEIEVDGGPPPDGESVRYYRMRYRGLSGWQVRGRVSAWSYRLKLF